MCAASALTQAELTCSRYGYPQLTCQHAPRLCLQCFQRRELSVASSPGCRASKRPLDAPRCMACHLPVDALNNRPRCTGSHCGASPLQLTGLQVAVLAERGSRDCMCNGILSCTYEAPQLWQTCLQAAGTKRLDLWLPDIQDGTAEDNALMRWHSHPHH